jgi:hypothetical protein
MPPLTARTVRLCSMRMKGDEVVDKYRQLGRDWALELLIGSSRRAQSEVVWRCLATRQTRIETGDGQRRAKRKREVA